LNFFWWAQGLVAVGAAVIHPHGSGATRLGAEAGSAAAAGVIRGSPHREFFDSAGVIHGSPRRYQIFDF
jgi:hypothetical protein